MPSEIVQNYRDIYTNYFMVPTLRNFRQSMVVQAFDDQGNGFPERYITINLNAKPNPDILAACISMHGDNGQVETCIAVGSSFTKLPKQDQKMYLAHEWIHAMMMFRNERNSTKSPPGQSEHNIAKRLSDQPEEALYGYWLTSNSFWQDDEPFSQQLKVALSQLLVPNESVAQVLHEDFQTNISRLHSDFNTRANIVKAIDTARDFVKIFSARYSVSPEIVANRLVEMVLKGG
jgi:hypothetical protein